MEGLYRKCAACGGEGWMDGAGIACGACNGEGYAPVTPDAEVIEHIADAWGVAYEESGEVTTEAVAKLLRDGVILPGFFARGPRGRDGQG